MTPEQQHLDKEVTLIFNGKDIEDRLVYAEMQRIEEFGYKLNGIDVSRRKLDVSQAEKITRELGGEEPQKVLSDEFLQSYLMSHVNNFNTFNTVGQLLENPMALKTPIIIKDGIMDYVDCLQDDLYEELKSGVVEEAVVPKQELQERIPAYFLNNLLEELNPKQLAVYFSVLMLTLSLIYQIVNVDKDTERFDLPPKAKVEIAAPAFAIVEI